MSDKVLITRHRYVLDWFEHKDIEIDLDDHSHFIFEFRLGSWFLISEKWDVDSQEFIRKIDGDMGSFELARPSDAYEKLAKKTREIRILHSCGDHFTEAVKRLIGCHP